LTTLYGSSTLDSVTITDLSTGPVHSAQIETSLSGGTLIHRRTVTFLDGDTFFSVADKFINNSGSGINDLSFIDTTDPDQGIALGTGDFATKNDVFSTGGSNTSVTASASDNFNELLMTMYADDPRAQATAIKGALWSTDPTLAGQGGVYDPNGLSEDIGVGITWDLGSVASGSSVSSQFTVQFEARTVPEPGSYAVLGLALCGLGVRQIKRKRLNP
jgi:hypothetical protein